MTNINNLNLTNRIKHMEIIIKKIIRPALIDHDSIMVHQINQYGDEYHIRYSNSNSTTPLDDGVLVVHAVLFHDGKKITVNECNKILSSNFGTKRNVRILKHKTF